MRMATISKMAQDLLDRMIDYEVDPEPMYEPELEALNNADKQAVRSALVLLIKGSNYE